MQKSKAAIFKAADKAISHFHAKGKNTTHQIDHIRKAGDILHGYIFQLAESATVEVVSPEVRKALEDSYLPQKRTDYCVYMMIRDIADVCRTLKRLTEGRGRSESEKLIIAKALCISLHEFLQ